MYRYLLILSIIFSIFSQPVVTDLEIGQMTDGSGLVRICYDAQSSTDSTISMNVLGNYVHDPDSRLPMVTLLDTLTGFEKPNYGWRVASSDTGERHCFLWDMTTDLGDIEECGIQGKFAVFDSMLESYSIVDSFMANDSLRPTERAFGLAYKHGQLWVMYHEDLTNHCWIRPYTLPELTEGDSIFIGTVAVGPSDMAFAGDRLFWIEDTRVILKEFDFETGVSHAVRSDWWSLPGTSVHLAGAAFDGENLWVSFSQGTFIALDTATFSLQDTMFFPEFGVSSPATSADGLAYGLGLIWCFSNDNIVYAIDPELKEIIHTIPTGEVVVATGAEGAAWDGVNLWVVDYSRYHVYQLSLFDQINFFYTDPFCLDNISPTLEWLMPSEIDYEDTLIAGANSELRWSATDSFLNGGHTEVMIWDDTVAILPSSIVSAEWMVYDWPDFDGVFNLFVTDSFGNTTHEPSGLFYIDENLAPVFYICPSDTTIRAFDTLTAFFDIFDSEDDSLTITLEGPYDAYIEGNRVIWPAMAEPGDTAEFFIEVCDEYKCDSCFFDIEIAPNNPPEFILCPDDFEIRNGDSISIFYLAHDYEGDSIEYSYGLPSGIERLGDSLLVWPEVTSAVGARINFNIIACDHIGCDSCIFYADIVPNMPPEFTICPPGTISFFDTTSSHIIEFNVEDPDSDGLHLEILSASESYLLGDSAIVYISSGNLLDTVMIIASDYALSDTCLFYVQNFDAVFENTDIPDKMRIWAYPNPFNSAVNIYSNNGQEIEIYDIHGHLVEEIDGKRAIWQPDGQIDSGIYIVRINCNGYMLNRRIVYIK